MTEPAAKDSPKKQEASHLLKEEVAVRESPLKTFSALSSSKPTPSNVVQLQHVIGNRAVQRLIAEEQQHRLAGDQAIPTTLPNSTDLQRDWDWGGAGTGALIGGIAGGLLGGPIGAGIGGLVGGLIGGLVAKPTVDPKVALKKAAEALVETGGTADASDKEVVVAEMIKMPIAALTILKQKGVKVVVCRNSVTEIREDLKGVKPRGWPEGKTWDTVPGLNDPGSNRVIIATRNGKVPPTGDGHGAHNLVLHEVGHAVGHNATTGGESDPRFIAAREKDKAQLDSYEGQAGDAGVEETYAESFARFYDADPNDAKLYPNLHAYWASNPLVADK